MERNINSYGAAIVRWWCCQQTLNSVALCGSVWLCEQVKDILWVEDCVCVKALLFQAQFKKQSVDHSVSGPQQEAAHHSGILYALHIKQRQMTRSAKRTKCVCF